MPLALGKMPAETERVTERVGNGRLDKENVDVSVVVPLVTVVVPSSS